MGEIGLLMAAASKDLEKLAVELATRKYADGSVFEEIKEMVGHFGALVMKMRVMGLIEPEVAEELMQFRGSK